MRRLTRSTAAAILMFGLVAGCGSDSKSSSDTAAPAAAGGDVTVAPAADGAPVSVIAADTSDTAQTLTVDPLTVKAGAVTFTFENTGNRQHEMIVLLDGLGLDPPAARHAEVEDHRLAAIGVDQAIFGAAAQRRDFRSGHRLDQAGWERAAQVRAIDRHAGDSLPLKVARQAAHGGFDFGQFGHGATANSLCQCPKLP